MLRRQGTISKQMMKQMNKPVATSNYRFCMPGYKEPPDNGLPIELLDVSRSERKRFLRSYFTGGDPELLANISFSSDSSSSNETKKQAKNRRKRRIPKKEYHKYSSSSSSSASDYASDNDKENYEDEGKLETREFDQNATSVNETKSSISNDFVYESEEECSELMSNINIGSQSFASGSKIVFCENFDKDKQQRRFTE